MSDWLDLHEYPLVGTLITRRLVLRKDQVLTYGSRDDGMTWIRTPSDCHLVTATVDEVERKINAQEWEEKKEA